MAGQFEAQLRSFGINSLDKIDKVRRSAVLELFKLVIYATPVESGRLRGNWQTTINSAAESSLDRLDPGGGVALAEAMANLGSLADVVWFTNNLPYAERIEYEGYSAHKAPEGMVRRHIIQWQAIVNAKAKAFM